MQKYRLGAFGVYLCLLTSYFYNLTSYFYNPKSFHCS